DITTVLLVNNESGHVGDIHGRFLTVRPEIGVLTSTARTFIQDGITTEFATKIVGTTLNNGRLYAQYLKKSSRVLYENENVEPSVVTSWVGEEDSQQTPLFLQSHNDLYNSDDTDWQDIDDSLAVQRGEFVGNTDFVIQQSTKVKDLKKPNYQNEKPLASLDPVANSNVTIKFDPKQKEEINKFVNAKVSSIEYLETYTVQSLFGHITNSVMNQTNGLYVPREERKYGRQNIDTQDHQSRSSKKQVLATVTYYGFAEFTTIVGDSVIVFSPSTIHSSLNFGHVTSIKGKPTLQLESIHNYNSEVLEISPSILETVTTLGKTEIMATISSLGLDIFDSPNDKESHSNNLLTPESTIPSTTDFNKIFLEKVEASVVSSQEVVPLASKTVKDLQSSFKDNIDSLENATSHIEPNIQKEEGATTVFIDDDPFTNFVELINSSSAILHSTDRGKIFQNTEISQSDKKEENITYQTIIDMTSDRLESIPAVGRSNESENIFKELCNHTTSQVFLTQMPKAFKTNKENVGDENIAIDVNPLFAYDIVETTKYYCIQATQSEQMPELNDGNTFQETTTESHEELIDGGDETTVRDSEDYDVTTENEYESEDDDYDSVTDDVDLIYKTLYTTYTYLTTFFEGSRTTVSSHTEILTNIISSTLSAKSELKSNTLNNIEENQISENTIQQADQKTSAMLPKYTIPVEIASLLIPENKVNTAENESTDQIITTYIDDLKFSKTLFTTYTYYTSIFTDNDTEIQSRTELVTNYITDKVPNYLTSNINGNNNTTQQHFSASEFHSVDPEIEKDQDMKFEIKANSSSINEANTETFIKNSPLDDQVSSESNTEEIIPSATLLLQTSFTTFTFYTTMYVGDETNIISRLETVTNVATETLQPTKVVNLEESSFPITYFTTFTYWTKLAKDGEITTLSREETLSNVIQPTNVTLIAVDDSRTADEKSSLTTLTSTDQSLHSDITTYYTTYTYYTTSYDVNMTTIIDSRFETVTNVVTSRENTISMSGASATDLIIKPSQPVSEIDLQIGTGASDIVLYDYKQIIDADEVSTLYFTTEIVSSINNEGHDIKVTSSTSRLHVNESKKSVLATIFGNIPDDNLSSLKLYKTGLVRLIEGKRIQNSTTTLYQSKVIGTVIDNRYAQIIESTSSFFFEKTQSDLLLLPTTVKISPVANINSIELTKSTNTESQETIGASKYLEITKAESDLSNEGLVNSSPQSTKRPFAPVIRPFASRNRPTFAPKQKTLVPSSATIITRSDITPTITATPALKSAGRYSSSRRGIISNVPINPNESSLSQGQSSRRLFGRPSKSLTSSIEADSALQPNLPFLPSKNRFASSSRPIVSSRRQNINVSYRSSNIPGFRGSGILTNSRLRIKPTNSGLIASDRSTQSITFAKELSSESSAEEENSTDEVPDEEENTKRNNNPLLRFRRPLNGPIGFTPVTRQTGTSPAVSLRRNPLSSRSKISTTTSSTTTTTAKPRPRSFQRPIGLQPRSRPQNTLFPPRGLFQTQQNNNVSTNDSEDEEDDTSNAEEDEQDDNRSKRSLLTLANSNSERRVRRQTDTVKSNRFRFRRQNQTSTFIKEESKLISSDDRAETTTSSPRDKSNSRFGSRFHSPQGHLMQTPATLVDSKMTNNLRSIRPTRPTTKRPQFTLREKDATLKGSTRSSSSNNFRRHPTTGSSSVRRPVTGNSNNRRLKSYVSYNNKNNVDHGRLSSTPRSRSPNSNTLNRGRSRGRNRIDYPSDLQSTENEVQAITITHFIPSEVTIPVVSGHLTEYKNIVTAKTSTELIGPNDYLQILGTNGLSSIYLNREVSSINIAGATEHTKYLLHESITSSVIFTPTTIRGRKTSFSHIIPSTAYSVEYIVTTIQPQISDNAPLANILLSQLLLGNLNLPAHQIIGAVGQPNAASAVLPTSVEPITEYRTHTSTYVTTIFDGKSTILPVTFQGKKILTTVYDTTAQTITATEYSVDTIVNALPSVQNMLSVGPAANVNNLLLQQLLIQQQQESLSLAISNTLAPQIFLSENLQDLDDMSRLSLKSDAIDNVGYDSDIVSVSKESQLTKSHRKKSRKANSGHKRSKQSHMAVEHPNPSVVTLYVSGRRPGEFSTVLSTVGSEYDHSVSLQKRHAFIEIQPTDSINYFSQTAEIKNETAILKGQNGFLTVDVGLNELSDRTASLESIVGDVDLWYAKSSKQPMPLSTTMNSEVI
ncbi:hypothetical protein KR084_000232, partial [Drosophila pseudotakahashii]